MQIGSVKKFEFEGEYREITGAGGAPANGAAPTYSGSTCDNFVLEYHITIEFVNRKADPAVSKAAHFGITKATVDLVYGRVTAAAGPRIMIPRKTSLTFVESDGSRTNSGSIGYLRGKNLRVGARQV